MSITADSSIRIASYLLKRAVRSDQLTQSSRRRLNQLLRLLSSARREEVCRDVVQASGRVVSSGPFNGMKIGERTSWRDGDILPKLLGSYEVELAPLLEQLKRACFDLIIDVGSAEGFFAVGSALILNTDRVIAVDIDQAALDATRENASINGISEKLECRLGLDAEGLRDLASKAGRCFVISDCEGFELELFSRETIVALKHSVCLIECHDFLRPRVTETLKERFAGTHTVEIVEEGSRNPNQYEPLRTKSSLDRWLAISEDRPETMCWLIARPKDSD